MDMGGEMQPLSEQVQAAPQAEPMQEAPLQTFEEAYPDLSQQTGAAPRRTLGLLGDMFGGASALDEYMTPEQRAQLQNQGVMAAAMQLLSASGPSRTPVGLGQALGEAYGAGQKGYTAAQQNLLTSMTMKQKMDEAKAKKDMQANVSSFLSQKAPEGVDAKEFKAQQYMKLADVYAASNPEQAGKYFDMAQKLMPAADKPVGEPFRAADGQFYQRTESGGTKLFSGGTVTPAAKAMGAPIKVTDVSGKQVLVNQMDDGTFKKVTGIGPPKNMVQVDVGGSIRFVDEDSLPPGTSFTKGLAPQIVGSADTGFYVYGGGGGGGTTVGGKAPPAAAGGAGAAPPPGGRQAAPGMTQIIPGTSFKNDEQLRGEFTRNMEPFVGLAQAFEKIQVAALNPSGAGDISLIYGYMKILDPRSTVMQGEQASAQNAGSVPESIRAKYNSIIAGEKLDPNVRADFLNQARLIIESQRTMANDVRDRYSELAQAYGLKPEQIVFDPFKRIKTPGDVAKDATPKKSADFVKQYDLLPKKP
jgi:hypothetical protein